MYFGGHGFLDYMMWMLPGIVLAMWAQYRVHSTYNEAMGIPAPLSGAGAARHVLDSAGLNDVQIEEIGGQLSDHYDPRHRVLRLSSAVYRNRTAAAVGIAAHEAGHALQHAFGYAPLAIRNAAVPVANFGSNAAFIVLIAGAVMNWFSLIVTGIVLFSAVVFFQLVNLPVEFNASARAKQQLVSLGILSEDQMVYVRKMLGAAALTYVAGMLQSLLTLLYYISVFTGGGRRD
ncbi:MAG: zinc metallopeptidase [Pirellulales bacterium]